MISARFQDYDAYADAIQRVDALFLLQSLEQRKWQIEALSLPGGVKLQHCWSGSGAIARGASVADGIELAIPAEGHFVANGEAVPLGDALFMAPGSEFLVSIPGVHRWFNLFIPESQAGALGWLGSADDRRLTRTCILRNRQPAERAVAPLLMRLVSNLLTTSEFASSEASLRSFQAELLAVLGAAFGRESDPERRCRGRTPIVDKASILAAVERIEASARPLATLEELVHTTGVSERSLRAGFHKYLGLTPTRYMQLRALNRAWQKLSAAGPGETTVARVAADLGIWDLGRFAMRYRRVFGEAPSETLRRT